MKKIWILFLVVIFASFVQAKVVTLPGSSINKTAGIDAPNLKAAELKYEPYPVEPGDYLTVWLKIKNIGNNDATDVKAELINKFPFTIDQNIKTVDSLPRNQETVIKFENIRIDENAIEDNTPIEFKISQGGAYTDYITVKINIEIRSVNPVLDIKVKSDPMFIPAGDLAKLSIIIKNLDNSIIKDISSKLSLPSAFVTIGSISEKKIDKLGANEEKTLEFDIMALADVSAKAYTVGLNITYYDQTGQEHEKDDSFGLLVGGNEHFDLNLQEADTFRKGTQGKVVFSISNTGASEIKFLTLEVLKSDDYVVIGNSKTYVGNLESDDFETAEFKIHSKKEGNIPIKLKLVYKDTYNKEKTVEEDINLKVYTGKELTKYGLVKNGSSTFSSVLYIVLVIFVYLTYREWRQQKDLPKAMKHSLKVMLKWTIKTIGKLRWKYLKNIPKEIKAFLKT